jgi:hypothetical protein
MVNGQGVESWTLRLWFRNINGYTIHKDAGVCQKNIRTALEPGLWSRYIKPPTLALTAQFFKSPTPTPTPTPS